MKSQHSSLIILDEELHDAIHKVITEQAADFIFDDVIAYFVQRPEDKPYGHIVPVCKRTYY